MEHSRELRLASPPRGEFNARCVIKKDTFNREESSNLICRTEREDITREFNSIVIVELNAVND